jgi:hypothetical protein
MTTKATTVEGYLQALPPDRRAAISAVREAILANKVLRNASVMA